MRQYSNATKGLKIFWEVQNTGQKNFKARAIYLQMQKLIDLQTGLNLF